MEEAVEFYKAALQVDANYNEALQRLGMCMKEMGAAHEMNKYFHMVLSNQPQNFFANMAMGQCYIMQVTHGGCRAKGWRATHSLLSWCGWVLTAVTIRCRCPLYCCAARTPAGCACQLCCCILANTGEQGEACQRPACVAMSPVVPAPTPGACHDHRLQMQFHTMNQLWRWIPSSGRHSTTSASPMRSLATCPKPSIASNTCVLDGVAALRGQLASLVAQRNTPCELQAMRLARTHADPAAAFACAMFRQGHYEDAMRLFRTALSIDASHSKAMVQRQCRGCHHASFEYLHGTRM